MKLAYGLGLSLTLTFGLVAGCDDDRNLADIGVGGLGDDQGGSGPSAGAPETSGGSDGRGGQSGGGADSAAGAGGAVASECPLDFIEADGQPCPLDGQLCSDGADDPCGFGNSLTCVQGQWQHQEAFPAPCAGAGGGGAGGADAGGAGGADAGGAGGNR